jgi:hypothetical protein
MVVASILRRDMTAHNRIDCAFETIPCPCVGCIDTQHRCKPEEHVVMAAASHEKLKDERIAKSRDDIQCKIDEHKKEQRITMITTEVTPVPGKPPNCPCRTGCSRLVTPAAHWCARILRRLFVLRDAVRGAESSSASGNCKEGSLSRVPACLLPSFYRCHAANKDNICNPVYLP